MIGRRHVLRTTHYDIEVPSQASHLHGLRIGFAADFHAGPAMPMSQLASAFALLRRLEPDLVVLGGDIVSESPRYLAAFRQAAESYGPWPHLGAVAVLGNHDLFVSQEQVVDCLASIGVEVLIDRRVTRTWGGGQVRLIGMHDSLHARPDQRVLRGEDRDVPSIVLWHEPDHASLAAASGALLQLSGHTHGGQVRLPGVRPRWTPAHGKHFLYGRFQIEGMTLIVSSGVGVYRPTLRFRCDPEIVSIAFR